MSRLQIRTEPTSLDQIQSRESTELIIGAVIGPIYRPIPSSPVSTATAHWSSLAAVSHSQPPNPVP
jgi:hypothetical protein